MFNANQMEPWIGKVIRSYGKRGKTARVNARVLRVDETAKVLTEDAVALVLLSDGLAEISGVLTREAWAMLQSLGVSKTVSSLTGSTVSLLRYDLVSQRSAEEGKSRLILTVRELTTVESPRAAKDHASCSSAHGGLSSDGAPCPSAFPVTACQERLSCLLKDLRMLVSPPCEPDRQGCPVSAETTSYLTTRWDTDRVRHRGDAPFCIPNSSLCTSEQQREEMQRLKDGLCVFGEQGDEEYPHSSDPDTDSLLRFGNWDKVLVNPWDVFASEVGISTLSEEGSEPVSPESLPEMDGSQLCSPLPQWAQPRVVSMVMSRQASPWSDELVPLERWPHEGLETAEGSANPRHHRDRSSHPAAHLEAKAMTLSPYLRPHSSGHRNMFHPCHLQPISPICDVKIDKKGVQLGKSIKKKMSPFAANEDKRIRGEAQDVDPMVTASDRQNNPKLSLDGTPALQDLSPAVGQLSPTPNMHISKHILTHPDGTQFSYIYSPTHHVVQALGLLRIPDDVVQWAARYLIYKDPSQSTD